MATATKTELQIFIETAAGFYRAIGELANVARRWSGDEFQREAHKAEVALQRTLDTAVNEWNCEGDSGHPQLAVCISQTRYAPHNIDACEIYTAPAWHAGYCPACASAKAAYELREAELAR